MEISQRQHAGSLKLNDTIPTNGPWPQALRCKEATVISYPLYLGMRLRGINHDAQVWVTVCLLGFSFIGCFFCHLLANSLLLLRALSSSGSLATVTAWYKLLWVLGQTTNISGYTIIYRYDDNWHYTLRYLLSLFKGEAEATISDDDRNDDDEEGKMHNTV